MDFKLLKQLYKIHSKSGYEGKIISFVCKWVDKNISNVKIDLDWNTGNIYITKGTSDTYPCMVAHLDQVQTIPSDRFYGDRNQGLVVWLQSQGKEFLQFGS